MCAIIYEYVCAKGKPSLHSNMSQDSGVAEKSVKGALNLQDLLCLTNFIYIYNISSHDFGAIETPRAEVYIFTTGTPYKISSRALLPSPLRTGNFTVECSCPEPFRV
jgi:hypothetical protein